MRHPRRPLSRRYFRAPSPWRLGRAFVAPRFLAGPAGRSATAEKGVVCLALPNPRPDAARTGSIVAIAPLATPTCTIRRAVCATSGRPSINPGPDHCVVNRPTIFFRNGGVMPETVTLKLAVPLGVDRTEWDARLRNAVLAEERALRDQRLAKGIDLLGRKAVRAASAFDSPKTSAPRRNLRPFVACRNVWRRIGAVKGLQRFRHAYHAARERFVSGIRDVLFPAGTFALRRLGVSVAPS